MSSVKIQNLVLKNPIGAMKLPTGGFGDYAVTVNTLADWIMTERDVATNTVLSLHVNNTSNPHNVTKAQVGLGNADNTSDTDKPVSTAQQTALDSLQTNLQTNINLKANSSDVYTKTQTYTQTQINDYLALKANSTDVYSKSQTYTKTEVDASLVLKLDATANAVSSSKWNTARTISTTGDATYSVSLDGSSNVSGVLTLTNSGVTSGTYTKVTVDSKGRVTSGAALSSTDIPTLNQDTTGNASTATKWATTRTISLSGVVAGSTTIDGSGDIAITTTTTLPIIRAYARVQTSDSSLLKSSGISTVVKQSTGIYRFTLSTAATDANYLVFPSGTWGGGAGASINLDQSFTQTTTQFQIRCTYGGDNVAGAFDPSFINVSVIY